ncbi:MAG: cell division protein ZipA [Gammaproteobacteria bacterium]|nr:cell division protein ZipA [Gammaproteobacteria bacterium]
MSEDYILIGGGLLIALVIMHGLWLAWRARRDPLPLDISSDVPDDGFDADELGPEFPNGGARVVGSTEHATPTQRHLSFEGTAPVLMDIVPEEPAIPADAVADASTDFPRNTSPGAGETPALPYASSVGEHSPAEGSWPTGGAGESSEREAAAVHPQGNNGSMDFDGDWQESRKQPIAPQADDSVLAARTSRGSRDEERSARRERETPRPDVGTDRDDHEILAINVLARGNSRFSGSELWAAFQRNGLTFGDMNIFHRLNPVTRTPQFSVANAIEPGTFDLSGMDSMQTPGACLFLRLPGPSEPAAVFDDMLRVARDIGQSLGGELKDENFSVLTGQTEEHYRQRIAEFSRKRMSRRY